MNSSASPSPYLDLSAVLRALRGEVGGWHLRGLLSHVVMMLLYRRLGEISGKIEWLVARFQAGRLWRCAHRARADKSGAVEAGGPLRAGVARIWPGQFAWLVRVAGYQAAGYGSQLRHILEQPEMVEFLKASPQAARILRPVCRMLAIETALLQPGLVVEVTEPKVKAPRVRVRKKRVPIDWGRIPLPRGVLTAARRQGFGKV